MFSNTEITKRFYYDLLSIYTKNVTNKSYIYCILYFINLSRFYRFFFFSREGPKKYNHNKYFLRCALVRYLTA